MFFNGANILRFQVICGLITAVCALAAKIWLAQTIGLPGIIWGTIIAYLVFAALPFAIYTPRLLANMQSVKY
jgi:hypothetical protein